MSVCEWDPLADAPQKDGAPSHGEAVVIVGAKGQWHLCESCAALPRFKRLRVRKPMRRPPAPPATAPEDTLPTDDEVAEYLAGHAQVRVERLAAAGGRPVSVDFRPRLQPVH